MRSSVIRSSRHEDLIAENERLSRLADERSADIADREVARDQIAAELAAMRQTLEAERSLAEGAGQRLEVRIDDLSAELDDRRKLLAELSDELETTLQQSTAVGIELAAARSEQESLRNRLVAAESDSRELVAQRKAAEQTVVET